MITPETMPLVYYALAGILIAGAGILFCLLGLVAIKLYEEFTTL